jgi:hypothetical protein
MVTDMRNFVTNKKPSDAAKGLCSWLAFELHYEEAIRVNALAVEIFLLHTATHVNFYNVSRKERPCSLRRRQCFIGKATHADGVPNSLPINE